MNPIPDGLRDFILRYIKSVEELETLLLLQRERRAWTPAQVGSKLATPQESAAIRLSELGSKGLVQAVGDGYRYQPLDSGVDQVVDQLARLYPQFRVRIIELIFSSPGGRIQTFADAFKFRKEDS